MRRDSEVKWYDAPIVIIDLETTGFSKPVNIVEIGAVRYERGELVDRYEALVRPARSIDYGAQKVHGISDRDVAHQPTFAERYETLRAFCRDAIPASYGDCDRRWLHEELDRMRAKALIIDESVPAFSRSWGPWLDLLMWARELWPQKERGRHTLEAMCERHEVPLAKSHRAIDDAEGAAGLMWAWQRDGWLPDCSITELFRGGTAGPTDFTD